jgi:hypothetical protein
MKKLIILLFSILFFFVNLSSEQNTKQYPDPNKEPFINPVKSYEGVVDEDLSGVMVPIQVKDRVYNKTGVQCVWSTIETLGKFAEESKLKNLTESPDCKSFANPNSTSKKLNQIKVKFYQTNNKNDRSLIVKSVVNERRGCLFAVPGHAMTLVHYDEKKQIVKYINNSDKDLKIRTWTMNEFNKYWDGWILVIYADKDIVPLKYNDFKINIPVIDRNNKQGEYLKEYIIQPKKSA